MVWWHVLIGLVLSDITWLFIRRRYYNPYAAMVGVVIVRSRWISALIGGFFLLAGNNYAAACMAGFWPFFCGLLTIPGNLDGMQDFVSEKSGCPAIETTLEILPGEHRNWKGISTEEQNQKVLSERKFNADRYSNVIVGQ
jgi:hypothetical protein